MLESRLDASRSCPEVGIGFSPVRSNDCPLQGPCTERRENLGALHLKSASCSGTLGI